MLPRVSVRPTPNRILRGVAAVALGAVLAAIPVAAVPSASGSPRGSEEAFQAVRAAAARDAEHVLPVVAARVASARASMASMASMASAPAAGDLLIDATTSYVLGDDSVVRVSFDATLRNDAAPVYTGYSILTSYLSHYGIPVLREAINLTATADGRSLSAVLEPQNDLISMALVDLEPDLTYQTTQAVHIAYELPPTGARTPGILRLNEAFATFPVFALGDPAKSTVVVDVPDRFEVDVVGSRLTSTKADGRRVYSAKAIANPDEFYAELIAADEDRLIVRDVDLPGEHDARVLAWPGDDEWSEFVSTKVAQGVPELTAALGMDWPAEEELDLVETVAPYVLGYAGWYSPYASRIDIGDELDAVVVLHEVSHVWFNDDLFRERWIDEGLADEYAAQVVHRLGDAAPAPQPIDPSAPGAVRLATWSDPRFSDEDAAASEAYGYNASWSVIAQIVEEIGLDSLSAAVRAAAAHDLTYAADGHPQALASEIGWKQLLDLLQQQGSQRAEGLFRDHVAAESDLALFDQRTATRGRYADLVAASDGWVPPVPVRLSMSQWDFADANRMMDLLEPLAAKRAVLRGELAALGLDEPAGLRRQWEDAGSLPALGRTLDADLAAVRSWVATDGRVDDRSWLSIDRLGSAFGSLPDRVDDARGQLAAGDFTAAAATLDGGDRRLDVATTWGIARLVAIVALGFAILRYRRSGLHLPPEHVAAGRDAARASAHALVWRHGPVPPPSVRELPPRVSSDR